MTTDKVDKLRTALKEYLDKRNAPEILVEEDGRYKIEADKLQQLYTESPAYQLYITEFHDEPNIISFLNYVSDSAKDTFKELGVKTSFIDVGCGSGFTGLSLALSGDYFVTFHDFEGLGLDFIRDYLDKNDNIRGQVIPYGLQVKRHTVAIALDVMEHTHNHLCTLRWLKELGDYVVLTYPLMPYKPPFIVEIDEYVDDEALLYICEKRYKVILSKVVNGRRFLIYK